MRTWTTSPPTYSRRSSTSSAGTPRRFDVQTTRRSRPPSRRPFLLPCWCREMTDDEAYMALVTDNAQGELSSIEKAIHCYGSVGEIEAGTREGKLTCYGKQLDWEKDVQRL